ncbi:hypothetical protein RJ641_002535 [Dillenia turbinata]|uniref:Uncharacterized protein n=1 Tax=Dillenia turbinata TaxID=194707 RepID=A0AAN8VJT7_9MAGN
MQNQEGGGDGEEEEEEEEFTFKIADGGNGVTKATSSIPSSDWTNFEDDDIMQQHSAIRAHEAHKIPFIGDKANMLPSLPFYS